MRGFDDDGKAAFAYVSCETRVPADHPLRTIRAIVDEALKVLSPEFDAIYAATGRCSVPPEKLLRALLLQAFYSVRSERQLMEQLDYNLLFRWFVGLAIDAPVWDVTVFTKNRERLLTGDIAARFMNSVLSLPQVQALLSRDHFTVDGTMVEAWASMKSFKRKPDEGKKAGSDDDAPPPATECGRNAEVDFHGETRSNATHASTTDPEARLYRKGKGKEAKLCFLGHALMENRNGLFIDTRLMPATGTAEREAATDMIGAMAGRHRITVGGDKNYDTAAFVAGMRNLNATPHVARNTSGRRSAIDGRVTSHPGYAVSQVIRKRIEEGFGWIKAVGMMAKTKLRGTARIGWRFRLTAAAYNLIRLPKLLMPDPHQTPPSQKSVSNISNTFRLNPRFSAAC
jgi:transposase